ncbi:hypothetical protein GPECTOR_27g725 [Gonium pectorale]|uniref:N-acetyltransferase domain-containing protein n=1 Tax=Gonium pectorale TaxID=33097 RepID=A0A150GFE9_GONPE|nr:hypothetical protein GPECTOR_27g725 [Gonium pectorale]|eukprot:KXZ48554.1 hypothetical protein GPECTOR_27g725 [Gonium pectorale]
MRGATFRQLAHGGRRGAAGPRAAAPAAAGAGDGGGAGRDQQAAERPVAQGFAAAAAAAAAAGASAAAVVVRVAVPGDAAALAALDAACAPEGSSGWSEGIYQADLQPGGPNLILLAELTQAGSQPQPQPDAEPQPQPETPGPDAAPVAGGTAAVVALAAGLEAGGEVSLTNLAVAPAARGVGLGRRMAEELLRRLGAERFPAVLEVRADNAAAQALYGRLDFEAAGRRRRYYADGGDSIVMIRQPAPLAPPRTPT